jgi:chromosome segregation ATPase
MNQQTGFFSRIARWFGRRGDGDAMVAPPAEDGSAIQRADGPRVSIFRPWAKRDAAFSAIQESFHTLTDLMGAIRQAMERQSERQEQLVQSLQSLPRLMESIPDGQKVQTETLRMIVGQMEQQNSQQAKLSEILDKVSDAQGGHQKVLQSIGQGVETLSSHDAAISDNLRTLGSAMQTASRYSESSAQAMAQMREQLAVQSGEMQRALQKQNTRFTTMMAVAIFLAVAALVAVVVMGYLMLSRGPS